MATDYATALAIARAKGGQRVYFTARPSASFWLVKLIGMDKARKVGEALCPAYSGLELDVPIGRATFQFRRAEVERMTLDGASKMIIAEHLGVHYRTVQYHRAALRAEGRLPNFTGPSGDCGQRAMQRPPKVNSDGLGGVALGFGHVAGYCQWRAVGSSRAGRHGQGP